MEDDFMPDLTKTYIHEDKEYILTGRTAEKTMDPVASKPKRSSRRQTSTVAENDIMVEIKPVQSNGLRTPIAPPPTEKKWVMFSSLYAVTNLLKDDDNDFTEEEDESTNSSN